MTRLIVVSADDLLALLSGEVADRIADAVVARIAAARKPQAPAHVAALPEFVLIEEAAIALRRHARTLRRDIACGRIRTVRLGTGGSARILIPREEITRLIADGTKRRLRP